MAPVHSATSLHSDAEARASNLAPRANLIIIIYQYLEVRLCARVAGTRPRRPIARANTQTTTNQIRVPLSERADRTLISRAESRPSLDDR